MFVDVSAWVASNPPARHAGAAVADPCADGRGGVFVAGLDGPNRLLRWSTGALRDAAPPLLADPDRAAVGVAAGDLDGDGREELYVTSADPSYPDRLFHLSADGRWSDVFDLPRNAPVRNPGAGGGVAVLDRRGVGRYGFVVPAVGRPSRLYEPGPSGTLADLAAAVGLARVGGRGLVALPVFGGRPDLFVVRDGGPNGAYRNRGDGTFDECGDRLGLADADEGGRGVTAVDVGGRFGLAWANADGPHRLMVPGGGGRWRDAATPGLAFPSAVRTVVAADFDNDGYDELFLHHHGEPNRLYRVVPGSGGPEVVMLDPGDALDPDGLGTGAVVGDFDGDGVLELLLCRDGQPLGLLKPRACGNGWLRVRPLTRFGAPARGAVVRLRAAGRDRLKGVCGGTGDGGQAEPVAHFGLGRADVPEAVSVTWPDGAVLEFRPPGRDRELTVRHPDG